MITSASTGISVPARLLTLSVLRNINHNAVIKKTEPQLAPKLVSPESSEGVSGVAFSATFSVCPISDDQSSFF